MDKTLAEVMAVEDTMKNVREYNMQCYIELGKKLGEAMFYFVKFQRFIEQLEKTNPNLIIKRVEGKLKTKESAKGIQCKTLLKRSATKNALASVDSLLEKNGQSELMQDKDLLQDIFSEYNSKYQYHEDSDASFDSDILEENSLKSLVCITQQKNLPIINKDTKTKVSLQVVKLKKDHIKKPIIRIKERQRALNRYNSNSIVIRKSEYMHKRPIEILTYMLDHNKNNDQPYISYYSSKGKERKSLLALREHHKMLKKPFHSLPLLRSIKQNLQGREHEIKKLSLNKAGSYLGSENTDQRKKIKKSYISSIMLTIKSQRMHLFKRVNSNMSRQYRTKTTLRTYT